MTKLWKWLFIVSSVILLILFFTNDFGMVDIKQTAIVTAMGIDKSDETDKIDVTAQIAVTGSSSGDTASNVEIKGAESLNDAIAKLNQKTGWYPTLVHLQLILIGEELTEQNVFSYLDYFLRSFSSMM